MQALVDIQIGRVLDALRSTAAYDNTIVIFSSDHGEMLGAHGGMHQKWHNAYEESIHVPFVVSSPLIQGGARDIQIPTSHADLLPTMLGFAGIDRDEALKGVAAGHSEAHPLVGRDLSGLILGNGQSAPSDPVLFTTDDEISEGNERAASPVQRYARAVGIYEPIVQPNHIQCIIAPIEVDGQQHLVKVSRYYDNQQFWTEPGKRDERLLRGKKIETVTEPASDQFELYDLTLDPLEQNNLAYPGNADDRSRKLQEQMLRLLVDQLAKKRLVPASGGTPGYRPPATS
jgi:hypothetical protein